MTEFDCGHEECRVKVDDFFRVKRRYENTGVLDFKKEYEEAYGHMYGPWVCGKREHMCWELHFLF